MVVCPGLSLGARARSLCGGQETPTPVLTGYKPLLGPSVGGFRKGGPGRSEVPLFRVRKSILPHERQLWRNEEVGLQQNATGEARSSLRRWQAFKRGATLPSPGNERAARAQLERFHLQLQTQAARKDLGIAVQSPVPPEAFPLPGTSFRATGLRGFGS